MKTLVCFVVIFVIFLDQSVLVESLTCLRCERISHPRFCKVVSHCNEGEVCYTEAIEDFDGSKAFNMGCTSKKQQCNVTGHGIDSLHCVECCDRDICNAKLCGDSGYPKERGPICFSCHSHLFNEPCNILQMCDLDEVCTISQEMIFSDLTYSSGCSKQHACASHNHVIPGSIIGKRDNDAMMTNMEDEFSLRGCHQCCVGDLCNHNCSSVQDLYPCGSSPCMNGGTCINLITGGYKCTCSYGYTGQNCDTELQLHDCLDVKRKAHIDTTGVYMITLPNTKKRIRVLCDMQTDGGGWTVFHKRFNGSVDFNQNFSTYENGFGNLHGEFWLGLKYIYELTTSCNNVDLRMDMEDRNGTLHHRVFSHFYLSPSPRYTLHIQTHNASPISENGMMSHNGQAFYTYDHDNNNKCGAKFHSGWWFTRCYEVNLNGEYTPPDKFIPLTDVEGMLYSAIDMTHSLKNSKMMLRRDERHCN